MASPSCGFSALLDDATACGSSRDYPGQEEYLSLRDCNRDITGHRQLYGLSGDDSLDSEWKLLLARAGVFAVDESHKLLTICPRHRAEYGIRWRCSKVRCSVPAVKAAHKKDTVKGDRRLDSIQSAFLLRATGILLPVGSPICKMCKDYLASQEEQEIKIVPEIEIQSCGEPIPESGKMSSPEESNSDNSVEDFAETFGQLKITDETFLSPDTGSTASTYSDESVPITANKPREKLNEFLLACELEPLGRPWLSWSDSTERTKLRQTKRATEIVSAVLKTVSPDNAGNLWQSLTSSSAMNKALGVDELPHSEQLYLKALAEAYHNAASWDTRRQVLSIMAGVGSFNDISRFIPGLTRYRFTMANLHQLQFGRGAQVPKQPTTRIRVDLCQLDHFLGFITSPHLIQDLPFGLKHLKLSSGDIIEVPNVIRLMIPQRVVQQYKQYCMETKFKPFSDSTMLRVLSECSASVRKSLQGLDYFAAEGARAFDDLAVIIRQIAFLGPGKEWEAKIAEALKTDKLYLKGDYKVHISNTSQVADHCPVFALSDSTDAHYQQRCDHDHTDRCDRCQSLAENLTEIEEVLKETKFPSDVEKDEAVFLFQTAKLSILSWKCHILRSFNQDQARLDALEQLDEGDIVIVNDWAMKFLPQKYRESQTDWFGKRGISWHISVVYRRLDGVLQWQGFVHIIQTCKQESSSVVKIMQDVLRAIKLENNEIRRAYFRQDNAGCYHSSSTILACPLISTSTGIKIQRIDFSDPQGGKGAADRLAATCKSHVRIFINEGNDVTTADQLKDALLSHGGVEGVRVVSMETIQDLPSEDDSRKIPAISKLNDFEFIADAITAWRAYGIGEGKEITVEKTSSDPCYSWLTSEFSPGGFKSLATKRFEKEKPAEVVSENTHPGAEEATTSVFSCPQDGCVKVFQRLSSLEKHLSLEQCTRSLEKRTLLDLAKLGYKSRLEEGVGCISIPAAVSVSKETSSDQVIGEGWALKCTKKPYRFNERQKAYLDAKFSIGQSTGKKLDGNVVAREMRHALGTDGVRLFKVSEFLTPQQVTSYFSRRSAKIRQQSPDDADIRASEEEDNFTRARESVNAIRLQHPITYNQYDICAMAKGGTLEQLKLDMLQTISQELQLEVPPKPIRRKRPYLDLLNEVVAGCTCQLHE
ncbi:uncharacterized protein LOC144652746 [Oculina patagonica]